MDERGRSWPIMVGADGSEPAQQAVRWAAHEAARQGRELRIVNAYVWLDPIRIGDPELCRRDAQTRVSLAAQMARNITPELTIDSIVVEGGARHHLLVETAQACPVAVVRPVDEERDRT